MDQTALSKLNCFGGIGVPLGQSRLRVDFANGSTYDGEIVVGSGDNYMWVPGASGPVAVDGNLHLEKPRFLPPS